MSHFKRGIMKKKTRLTLLRVLLGILIVANMILIFAFSGQSGKESAATSSRVTRTVARIVVNDFDSMTQEEQDQIVIKLHPTVRKLAHMTEFGSLGALVFLFLLTWKGTLLWRYAASLGGTFLYACTDETHQMFSDSRGPQFSDVLIDTSGAFICCSVILLMAVWIRSKKTKKKGKSSCHMKTTRYYLRSNIKNMRLRIVVVSDLHGEGHEKLVDALRTEQPDLILIPGDLMEDEQLADKNASGYDFLRTCVTLAPTYYSLGNHEIGCYHSGNPWKHPTPTPLSDKIKKRIAATGAVLLDNAYVHLGELCICGLTSGINGEKNEPNQKALDLFANQGGFRILLCHHPEYFVPYIKKTDIELTVCGHAHGGQWRVFGHGIYAPGQGLFPKYTAGVLENRCVISRGLGNHTHIPRIFNPRELVMIYYGYQPSEIEK